MNLSKWFFYLIVGCLACSKSATIPDSVVTIDGPYRVTASLNDSTWFGSAYASKSVSITGETACIANRFDIRFSTDLPYTSSALKQAVTGCSGDCIPTQILTFYHIPLALGKYGVSDLNSCAAQQGAVIYNLLIGGDGIIKTYTSQGSSAGWLQVTGYNESQKAIEGTFEVELSDKISKTARFKNGTFKALINQ